MVSHPYIQLPCKYFFFFLWWKLLRSTLLATFKYIQYSIINCSCHGHHIPMTYLYFNWNFVPLNLLYLFCLTFQSSLPTPLATISLLPVPMNLFLVFVCFFLDSTYKWNHMVFVFVWLISLSIMPSMSIHVVIDGVISFFFIAE